MPDLSQVTIGIKSFLRTGKLTRALTGIQTILPECKIIVADDGHILPDDSGCLAREISPNETLIECPFDSGFGFKSNLIASLTKTPYLLIGSDDFDFEWSFVRNGIEKLVKVLDENPGIHIASGRVNSRPYEFDLIEYEHGQVIQEVPAIVNTSDIARGFMHCGLTVNYSLICHEVFDRVHWDDDVKIGGGEHGAFFLDCKRAGFKTVYVPGVNIFSQPGTDSSEYMKYRNRARASERPCFDKRGIKKYILGNGALDYDATVGQ